MNEDLDKKIFGAECALKDAESNFGFEHVAVAQQLEQLAILLRQKKRILDAVNCEAKARKIRTGDSRPDLQPPVQHGTSKAKTTAAPAAEMNSFGLPVSMLKSAAASTGNRQQKMSLLQNQ